MTKYTENHKHYKDIKNTLEKLELNETQKSHLYFALGKYFEDIKDYKKSFLFYEEANKLHRKKINFSIKKEKDNFLKVKEYFNKKVFKEFNNLGNKDESAIFILGLPRSGTTLVEQILSNHSNVYGADEIYNFPELIKKNFCFPNENKLINEINLDRIKTVGNTYIDEIKKISNNSLRITDKLPLNFLYVGFIKICLPNSKIIHCYREPMDNILSIYKNHFTSNKIKYAYELKEIVEYYNLYKNLLIYWNKLLPSFIINIKYENLISKPNSEIKKLIKSCNLDWSEKCLNFYNNKRPIKTASNSQARNKIYKTSVNSWKNYENYLKKYKKKIKN